MENKRSQLKRILLFAGIAVAILFFMDLNNRITILYQKNTQRNQLRVEVYHLMQTKDYIQTQVAYATSDRAVEEWARSQGRWVKEGDIPVYLIPDSKDQSIQSAEPTVESKKVQNWDVWKLVLFGD